MVSLPLLESPFLPCTRPTHFCSKNATRPCGKCGVARKKFFRLDGMPRCDADASRYFEGAYRVGCRWKLSVQLPAAGRWTELRAGTHQHGGQKLHTQFVPAPRSPKHPPSFRLARASTRRFPAVTPIYLHVIPCPSHGRVAFFGEKSVGLDRKDETA